MAVGSKTDIKTKKLKRPTTREFNTALYFLRCKQLGLSLRELFDLDYGEVSDLFIESANDHEEYDYRATQDDFNSFGRLF